MADDDTHTGMMKTARSVHGPRSIASVVPVVVRPAFRGAAPAIAQLMEAWSAIVGPAIAAVTTPRRLAQGALTIECPGPVAMELQHLSPELLERINRYLGFERVRRLRFAQSPCHFARPGIRRGSGNLTKVTLQHAHRLPDGPLRSALLSLGRALLSDSASRLGR
jgi:hypothetical protein